MSTNVWGRVLVGVVLAGGVVQGQAQDPAAIVAGARQALGGEDRISAVKTISVIGRNTRTRSDGTAAEADFEISIELPDKYMRRDVIAALGPTSIYRNTGFNGDALIDLTDMPPQLNAGGNVRIAMIGPGGAQPGQAMTPEQKADLARRSLAQFKRDFARLTLGMFVASFQVFPIQFKYAGEAESADGKAQVLEASGSDGFTGRLFVDATTHLPLMFTWMDKEPLVMSIGGPGGRGMTPGGTGGGAQTFVAGGGRSGQQGPMSKEDMDKMQQEMAERMKDAEAKRQVVEYRLYYGDYKTYDGLKLPTRIQQTVAGKPTQEVVFDKVKLNAKIDAKKFEPTK